MNERIVSYVRNPWITLGLGGVLGAAVGATTSYLYVRRQASQTIMMLNDEIEDMQRTKQLELDFQLTSAGVAENRKPQVLNVVDNLSDLKPGQIVVERIVQPDPELLDEIETEDEGVRHNIFDGDDEWDYAVELPTRNPNRPYIIHADEFAADERGFDSQSTLTWYEGDQILTDSSEVPIYDVRNTVGELRFGHGSGDPNVVYIRNEKLRAEYEIVRDFSSYQDTVLGGLDGIEEQYSKQDLKHSKQPLRFRIE